MKLREVKRVVLVVFALHDDHSQWQLADVHLLLFLLNAEQFRIGRYPNDVGVLRELLRLREKFLSAILDTQETKKTKELT